MKVECLMMNLTDTIVASDPGGMELTTIDPTSNPELHEKMARPRKILADIFAIHPDWAEYFDEVDPFSATAPELLDLITSAPNDAAVMLLYGFFSARIEIAAMTGRPFV